MFWSSQETVFQMYKVSFRNSQIPVPKEIFMAHSEIIKEKFSLIKLN